MAFATSIANINMATLHLAPVIAAGVQAAELTNADGGSKLEAVVNTTLGITGALETSTNPEVAGVAALTNFFVSLFNALGHLKKKPAVAVEPVVAAPPVAIMAHPATVSIPMAPGFSLPGFTSQPTS